MSDPGTAAFKAAWAGRDQRESATLIKIELTRPSTQTLYLSAREEIVTPGGTPQVWEGGLVADVEPLVFPGSLRESSWSPASGGFTLVNAPFNFQTGSDKAPTAFVDYGWIGAAVTFYLWEKSLTDFADALAFKGFVIQDYEVQDWKVIVRVIQRFDWNRECDLVPVTRKRYPRAPEDSIGKFIPKVRGSLRGVGLRSPWASEYGSDQHAHERLVGGRRALPGVVVDGGGGGTTPGTPTRIAYASHACKTFYDSSSGCVPFIEVDSKMCTFGLATATVTTCECAAGVAQITRAAGSFITDGVQPYSRVSGTIAARFNANTHVLTVTALTLTVSNTANTGTGGVPESGTFSNYFNDDTNGAGIIIGDIPNGGVDPFGPAMFPMPPINNGLSGTNDAENPRAVLDVANDTSYARLDYDAGTRIFTVYFPDITPPGDLISYYITVGYRTTGAPVARIRFNRLIGGAGGTDDTTLSASSSPTVVTIDDANNYATEPWQFSQCTLQVFYDSVIGGAGSPAGSIIDVFFVGLIIKFTPKRETVAESRGDAIYANVPRSYTPGNPNQPGFTGPAFGGYQVVPVFGYSAVKWFATLDGYADDGSGTYTGVASALIERAPDIAQHVLVVDGGQATSDIERAASTFGSFVDARADLLTWRQSSMVHALVMTDPSRVSDALDRLCRDAGIWVYLSEFDNKFKCIVWDSGVAVDGLDTLTKRRLSDQGPRLRPTPGSRRATGVRVLYGFDYYRGHTIHECSIGPDRSNSSHKYLNLRDQQLSVVASGVEQNNKLDFHFGGSDYTATLTTGDYADGWTAAQDVKTKMNAAAAGDWVAGYGFKIVTGTNDTIRYSDGAAKTLTITQGEYATGEALAAQIQADFGAGYTVTYSRTTKKFTLTKSAGTFQLLWSTGAVATKRAMAVLGFKLVDKTAALTYTGDYEREEERIHIGNLSAVFDLEWRSGTNGADGTNTNCANMLGFNSAQDDKSTGATDVSFLAASPVNIREQNVASTVAVTDSERPAALISGDTIYDHDTAREVRDRAADLLLVDRPSALFPLVDMPWVERGRVMECDTSLDDLWPYAIEGSDGSWAGKKFQVLSKVQHMAGSYVTELVTAEVS